MINHYEERDAFALDKAGGYYSRHVVAMTKEGLHSKSDIDAGLAHRDMVIDGLKAQAVEAEYKDLLHVVANQYDGNDGREWSIGANHVFMLFAKEINKRVNQLHHLRGKND